MNTKSVAYVPAKRISAGAIRAGRNISERFRRALPNLPETNAETLAEIIDRETLASELLDALETLDNAVYFHARYGTIISDVVKEQVRDTIRKAKGEQ